ncbi:MAG: ABC transporter substrate-binding protein [Clostridia bacterium]|nr:ABC transporter substrate-binding protein [Clostridia bacterium]
MTKTTKRVVSAVLAVLMLAACVAASVSCGKKVDSPYTEKVSYTYKSYSPAIGNNWNTHTWETNADDAILSYLYTPLCTMTIKDTEAAEYQWIYLAAESVTDVTKDHKDDLVKYGSAKTDADAGYVYEIKLNKNLKWENGEKINADTYVTSMKLLLDPTMLNYRANLFYNGESAVAGAANYYFALQKTVPTTILEEDIEQFIKDNPDVKIRFNIWEMWGAEGYLSADGKECPQYLEIDDETVYSETGDPSKDQDVFSAKEVFETYCGSGYFDEYAPFTYDKENKNYNENYDFSTVGFYKVDDYTVRYVLNTYEDINYFRTSLTSDWLVYEPLYTKLIKEEGGIKVTSYGTSKDTTMSYGPYKMAAFEADKQVKFTQNENWFGYQKDEYGNLFAFTGELGDHSFTVDGKSVQMYQTTDIVIDVLTDDAAKLAFLKGELDDWAPSASDLTSYATSSRMYKVDETYSMTLFFNVGRATLENLEKEGVNKNGLVLGNKNFRKAMSLAIDRSTWVGTTQGYKAAAYLMNNLYYYNAYEDPSSQYRTSEPAMKGIVDFYGVKYGDGELYKTLEDAYKSITGYNKAEAAKYFKTACEELVAAGDYKENDEIKITVAWTAAAMTTDHYASVKMLEDMLNAAAEGTGIGKITLEGLGNLENRYADVPEGKYAVGYGGWGGAAFYPFTKFQVFLDPDMYDVCEIGSWDPKSEKLTLKVDGKDVTMTYQEWAGALSGEGVYADAEYATKLDITAQLEVAILDKFYTIPLCSTTSASLLSFKVNYYTQDYNIMYGFGGIELMTYNYTDAQWTEYVKSQGGELIYK